MPGSRASGFAAATAPQSALAGADEIRFRQLSHPIRQLRCFGELVDDVDPPRRLDQLHFAAGAGAVDGEHEELGMLGLEAAQDHRARQIVEVVGDHDDLVPAARAISGVVDVLAHGAARFVSTDGRAYLLDRGACHRMLTDDRHWRLLATPYAWRRYDPHAVTQCGSERADQIVRAGQFARQRVAYAHREGGRRFSILPHDVEMVIAPAIKTEGKSWQLSQ